MIQISQGLLQQFDKLLDDEHVLLDKRKYYKKWLRYYFDFCLKYEHVPEKPESLPAFINKLREKKQSRPQQKQAFDTIILYYKIFNIYPDWSKKDDKGEHRVAEKTVSLVQSQWKNVYKQLNDEIRTLFMMAKDKKTGLCRCQRYCFLN